MSAFAYGGTELDLFANAHNWKSYWSRHIRPFLGARILDVGAGIGSTARMLCDREIVKWVALEPDADLAARIEARILSGELPRTCEVRVGTIADLSPEEKFDSVLYIDVLEHILDDRSELDLASRHLSENGRIVVLSPAHQWLYTAFDEALGHYRRYNRTSLGTATPELLELERIFYLDSAGLCASFGNRVALNSAHPTEGQLKLWDCMLVPVSRILDPLTGYRIGKSIVGVWRKQAE